MASSSKNINMPVLFAISIGAAVSLVVAVMFALAWYEYEDRVVINDHVLSAPMHTDDHNKTRAEQEANLGDIEKAMLQVATSQGDSAQ